MKQLLLDNQKASEKIFAFLKKEFQNRDKTKAVLGISGGIDSAVCGFLCKKAGLDLHAMILPYQGRGLEEAKEAVRALNLSEDKAIIVDITSLVEAQIREFRKVMELDEVDKGNIMARQRMIIQYALSRSINGLVIGTENLSEYYLGYFTLYGDQACDISPIAHLWKTQVFSIAEYLGVPKKILEKKPSADLWQDQTDEKEFGFTYKDADKVLYFSIVKGLSKEEIIKKGFSLDLVDKVLDRVAFTEHKRQNSPKL